MEAGESASALGADHLLHLGVHVLLGALRLLALEIYHLVELVGRAFGRVALGFAVAFKLVVGRHLLLVKYLHPLIREGVRVVEALVGEVDVVVFL